MTYDFFVPNMACNHCKQHIEKALADSGIADSYSVKLSDKSVCVDTAADKSAVIKILDEAGYHPA